MKLAVLLALVICYLSCINAQKLAVTYLNPGDKVHYIAKYYKNNEQFQIYCYEGRRKSIVHVWQSIVLNIDSKSNQYGQYEGPDPESVKKEYDAHRSKWFNLFSWNSKNIKLDPFNQSCLGIESSEDYVLQLNLIRIDYWKVILLVVGIFLYVSAGKLSNNVIFYYICGITLGICASFMILIYFLSKLFPRKPMMYGILATGWSVSIYFLQFLWDNLRSIVENYKTYLLWYTALSALISFVICYRYGPIQDQKTKNLIKWTLQGAGLTSMFFSSHFQEAAVGQIVILLLFHNIPSKWMSKPKTYWKKRFPPKQKMLSNDEYYEQGVKETTKALEELREFCASPQCNQWKTALKLKDVKRFASFIEGNSHLSDEEILEYETSIHQTDLTDEEEELLTDED